MTYLFPCKSHRCRISTHFYVGDDKWSPKWTPSVLRTKMDDLSKNTESKQLNVYETAWWDFRTSLFLSVEKNCHPKFIKHLSKLFFFAGLDSEYIILPWANWVIDGVILWDRLIKLRFKPRWSLQKYALWLPFFIEDMMQGVRQTF